MMETWLDIPNFPGYEISTYGRIYSHKRSRCLSPAIQRGYAVQIFSVNGKIFRKSVHRLVAITFLGEHPGLEVNHIDGNKLNNRLENLEWVTSSENQLHAYRLGLQKESKGGLKKQSVKIVDTGEIFESMIALARHLRVNPGSVQSAVNRKHKVSGYTVVLIK